MSTDEVEPIDGAGKIDPSLFPVPSTLVSTLEARAAKLRTGGQNMEQTGDDIVLAWGGLTNCYSAPEAETLYAALDPLTSHGAVIGLATNRVAGALETFAETVREIKAQWRSLKADAYAFRSEIADEGEDWDQGDGVFGIGDSSNVERNEELLLRAANLVEAFKEAEVACANKINIGIDGRTDFLGEEDLDGAMPDASQFVHGAGVELEELPTSWGEAAADTDHGWARDVGDAVWDFGVGAVEGVGAMVGAHSSEGWLAQSWGDSLKEYHWDNLTSAASLVGMYDAESDSLAWSGLGSAGEAWKDLAHSVVPWEEWGDRPGYVIGTALLNIGATVGGAVLTATGVGAVVGVPLMAWRGAAILDGMGTSGRGGSDGDGGSGVDLPDLPTNTPTYGGVGAPVVNVNASSFSPAQAAQVAASVDRLNIATSGGGSSSSESTSGGGRSNQTTSSSNEAEPNKPKKPTASQEDPVPSRDKDSESESILSEQLKDEAEQPWESTPGNAEASAADPSSAPSLEQQPTTSDALTVERLMDPVSAENTHWRDTYGTAFSERDSLPGDRDGGDSSGNGPEESDPSSRVPENDEAQLVGAAARGGGEGAFSQASSNSSSSTHTVNLTDIGETGPNNGRPGGEVADGENLGNNGPDVRDRTPVVNNQDVSGPSPTREVSSGSSQVGHFEVGRQEGNAGFGGSRAGDQTTGGSPSISNGAPAFSAGSSFQSRGPLSTKWTDTWTVGDRGDSGPEINDGAKRVLPDNELNPRRVNKGDPGFSPNPNERFGVGEPLSPNTKYKVTDTAGSYRGEYATDGVGEIRKIRVTATDFSQVHPEFTSPRPNAEYQIDTGSSSYRYETNMHGRNVESEGTFTRAKAPRFSNEESAVTRAANKYYEAYNKLLREDFSQNPEKYPGRTEAPQFESVTWNGGHVVGIGEFGGIPERLNQVAMLDTVNKHAAKEWRIGKSYRNFESGMRDVLDGKFDRLIARSKAYKNDPVAQKEYLDQVDLWKQAYDLNPPPPDIRARVTQIYDPNMPEFEVRRSNGNLDTVLDAPPAGVSLSYKINGVPQQAIHYVNKPLLK